MSCTVWPEVSRNGETKHLVIELRAATQGEITLALQREVAERLLLSALRERDAADLAETSRRGAAFLAAEGRRLVESLDESATLVAMESMSLPHLGDWCIVDTLDDDDTMHRLAIIHPDPAKQLVLEELEGRWIPTLDDEFGLPAALRNGRPMIATDEVDAALANAQHDPEILRALRQLGTGPLLTVPLVIRDRLIGAITFVGGSRDRIFSTEDVELAEALASLSATALDRARSYGEAIALKLRAEEASEAKSVFLGMVSHELLTPLNAIGGYVDILDLEIHGPITAAQRVDLSRIRRNQRHVVGLINDLLNLTRVNSGRLEYNVRNIVAQ
ncbi:MAG: GAF domain-containing protein, partial [Gemmatimonadaceae bacterium]|nr:GAF domain-containing protein [Gemmatimonadaceae bacterium]